MDKAIEIVKHQKDQALTRVRMVRKEIEHLTQKVESLNEEVASAKDSFTQLGQTLVILGEVVDFDEIDNEEPEESSDEDASNC